jgi:hypothetical protein
MMGGCWLTEKEEREDSKEGEPGAQHEPYAPRTESPVANVYYVGGKVTAVRVMPSKHDALTWRAINVSAGRLPAFLLEVKQSGAA